MYLVLLVFVFLYALFLNKPKGLVSRLFLSTAIFFGVNTLYFFFSYVFSLSLSLNALFLVHLFYSIIWWILIRGELSKRTKKEFFNFDLTDLMLVIITILTCATFYQATISFNNGFRLPVFSFTQDAANHMIFTKEILDNNKLETIYPLGFHSNVWLLETLVKSITNNNVYDQIVFTNIFSIFTIFIMVIISGLFYLIAEHMAFLLPNKKKILLRLLLVFLVTFFGMIIPYYLLADGFYSTLFNQVFIFAIILFLINGNEDQKGFKYIFIPLIIGFIYSYIFFIPALLFFFTIFVFLNRKKSHRILLLITILFSFLTIMRYFQLEDKALWLANADGAFVDYSTLLVLSYTIPTVFYLYYFHKQNFRENCVLIQVALSFLFFALLLAVYQLITTGFAQYSFYKTFSVVMMIFAVFSIIAIYKLLENIYLKISSSKLVLYIFIPIVIYSFWKFFPQLSTYSYQNFTHGTYNFFENNKEKYNAISFVSENMNNFDQYIYIDQNFSSNQWGNKFLKINSLNAINKNSSKGVNASVGKMKDYIDVISGLKKENKLLIIDPLKYMQINCEAEEFVNLITSDKFKNDVVVYPHFDINSWRENCQL